jgi:peptide/nickel transport system substrate-binding protein
MSPFPERTPDEVRGRKMTELKVARVAATGAAMALLLAGCGGGSNGDQADASTSPTASAGGSELSADIPKFEFGIDDKATGPAPEISGAQEGGTVRVVEPADVSHLDPARIYVNYFQNVSALITRTLTGYRQSDGKVTLVGDLAENTGTTTDGGKTWTYKLRDGITYEDGTPILAEDIKYGIERSFVTDYAGGPTYVQEWLADGPDIGKFYKGPYGGKSVPGVTTPDKKTIVFKFKKAHPDMPYAVALPMSAPVKQSADTKAKYDLDPFATGPYKVTEHKPDKSLVLVRNDKWDPKSDPIHYQYADKYEFSFGQQTLQINESLIDGSGDLASATMLTKNVSPELVQKVLGDTSLKDRTTAGYTPFVDYYTINNKRVPDLEVRKALLFAFPKAAVRTLQGGPPTGDFATTIGSPTLAGFEASDEWKVPPAGDPARAKQTLTDAKKLDTSIVYAYPRTDVQEKVAVKVQSALEEGGFKVVLKPINDKTYYDETGKLDNKFDLFFTGWGADWPSGSTVYPPLLDGRRIAEQGTNYEQFNDPAINKEMDRIAAIADLNAASKAWAELDKTLMKQVPMIPFTYVKQLTIQGPKLGGSRLDIILGEPSLNGMFVKK